MRLKPGSYLILGMLNRGIPTGYAIKRPEILPLAQRASGRFALIVAREGADYYAWRAGWFRQIENELANELDAQ